MTSDRTGPGYSGNAAGLLILRFFLGIFLLQWSVEKLILPTSAIRISQSFYNVPLPQSAPYFLGAAELILSLALLFGAFRTASYGLALAVHSGDRDRELASIGRSLRPCKGRQSSVDRHLADVRRFRRALPDAIFGHLHHRWLTNAEPRGRFLVEDDPAHDGPGKRSSDQRRSA